MDTNFNLDAWYAKRKTASRAFTVFCIVLGVEYSMTFSTLWSYLNTLITTNNAILFYSLISASYYISMIVSSLAVSRIVDASRNIRLALTICNCFMMVGNVVYSLPFSPWLVLAGRLISGGGGAIQPVMVGEVARCYDPEQSEKILSMMGVGWCFGFVVGPAANLAFLYIDFKINTWHVTYANFIGLFMALICMLQQVCIFFFVSDLSKEHDPKASKATDYGSTCVYNHRYSDTDGENIVLLPEGNSTRSNTSEPHSAHKVDFTSEHAPGIKTVAKRLLLQIDPVIIMICSFLFMMSMVALDIWIPMLVIEVQHWTIREVNIIVAVSGGCCALVFLCALLKPIPQQTSFFVSAFGVTMIIAIQVSFIMMKIYSQSLAMGIIGWSVFSLTYGFVELMQYVFLVSTLAKMVPSSCQSFAESIRIMFMRIGTMLALLFAAPLFSWIVVASAVFSVLCTVMLIALLVRRKAFIDPEIVF